MTTSQLLQCIEGTRLNDVPERDITYGYTCDLLSWVMAKGKSGTAWITVQTHLNVIAVAALLDMPVVIHPDGVDGEEASIKKAEEEGIAVIKSPLTAFDICARLSKSGVASV